MPDVTRLCGCDFAGMGAHENGCPQARLASHQASMAKDFPPQPCKRCAELAHALGEAQRHDCSDWRAEGLGCRECNQTAREIGPFTSIEKQLRASLALLRVREVDLVQEIEALKKAARVDVGAHPDRPSASTGSTASGNEATRSFFRVEVSDFTGQIVAIEPAMLAGREIGPVEAAKIREAIRHLRAFLGLPDGGAWSEDELEIRLNCLDDLRACKWPLSVDPERWIADTKNGIREQFAGLRRELATTRDAVDPQAGVSNE